MEGNLILKPHKSAFLICSQFDVSGKRRWRERGGGERGRERQRERERERERGERERTYV